MFSNIVNRIFSSRAYPGFMPFAYWNFDHAVRSLSSNHHIGDAANQAGGNNSGNFARDLILGDKINYIPAVVFNSDVEVVDFLERLNTLAWEDKYEEAIQIASRTAVHSGDEVGKEYQTFKPYGMLLAYAAKYRKNIMRIHWGPIYLNNKRVSDELFQSDIWVGRHKLTFRNGALTYINSAPVSVG